MFDHSEVWQRDNRSRRRVNSVWNCLTVMVMLTTLPVVFVAFLIYMYPYSNLNPFPPPQHELFPSVVQVTPGATENAAAPTPFLPSFSTDTAVTLVAPTAQPDVVQPPAMTATPAEPDFNPSYAIQNAPDSIDALLINPSRSDCKWMGVGGQVLTIDKRPRTGVLVEMGGTLGDNTIDLESLSGTSIQYGPAGYEFTLADMPIASFQTLWIRLIDETGKPLSERTYLTTIDACEKNLTIVNFIEIRP